MCIYYCKVTVQKNANEKYLCHMQPNAEPANTRMQLKLCPHHVCKSVKTIYNIAF
jgi:hypothetical protein